MRFFFHRRPDYGLLWVFRCKCHPYLCSIIMNKLDARTPNHKEFICIDPSVGQIYVSQHQYDETLFPFTVMIDTSSTPTRAQKLQGWIYVYREIPSTSTPAKDSSCCTQLSYTSSWSTDWYRDMEDGFGWLKDAIEGCG